MWMCCKGYKLQSRQINGLADKFGSKAELKPSVHVYYFFQVNFKMKKLQKYYVHNTVH